MSQINGVVTAKVLKVDDENGEGRVQINLPRLGGNNKSKPAPVATLMAGSGRGSWFMPEEGDEVLVAFDHGDVNHPYIVGYLWNGEQTPPETNRRKRLIRSVNGHMITFFDKEVQGDGDRGSLEIRDAQGNYILLENGDIKIHSVGTIVIEAPNVTINGRAVCLAPKPI